MKKLISLAAILCLIGCATYQKPPQQNFIKVLGVTAKGDTILVDINSLRPRIYNNYYYDNGINRYPNNRYWNNPPVIINYPPVVRPKPRPNPPVSNPPISKPIEKPNKNPKRN